MTIREAIFKIENYQLAWLDIDNIIASSTEYNAIKLKQFKSEIGFRIIEKKRDVGCDPVKLFEPIYEDVKKRYKDKSEEELKKILIEKRNEPKHCTNGQKLHAELLNQLRIHSLESEIEYHEKDNYLFLISYFFLFDKHGKVIADTYIQIYPLMVVEAAIEGMLKIDSGDPEAIEALKEYLEKHYNISESESEFIFRTPATYQEDKYFDYAYHLYAGEKITWEEVYNRLTSEQKAMDMKPRYISFDSFKRNKSIFDKKQERKK